MTNYEKAIREAHIDLNRAVNSNAHPDTIHRLQQRLQEVITSKHRKQEVDSMATLSEPAFISQFNPAYKEKPIMKSYTIFEVIFVLAPTKTQEEQGVGASIVSGPTPITVMATSESAAVAAAARQLDPSVDLSSSLINASVRVFG